MSDPQIIRPRLAFEREFGQHRNWWVRDPRIAGNPLSIYLYLLSHDAKKMPTQTEAMRELGLGVAAWQAAKRRLLETGFLVEVRDRYPRNYVDSSGRPRGGQRRFRLFLQDPGQGESRTEHETLLDLNEPYEQFIEAQERLNTGQQTSDNKPQIRASADNPHTEENPPTADYPHTEDFPQSFKEEKTGWLVGSISSSNQPTSQAVSAREAELDLELAGLHPNLWVTMADIRREIAGRVDLAEVDVVQAVRDVVLRTAERGQVVRNPAALVAAVIVRNPAGWPVGATPASSFAPARASSPVERPAGCATGDHWWGPDSWAEIDRANCVHCGLARRTVDPAFAELEAEILAVGGEP